MYRLMGTSTRYFLCLCMMAILDIGEILTLVVFWSASCRLSRSRLAAVLVGVVAWQYS